MHWDLDAILVPVLSCVLAVRALSAVDVPVVDTARNLVSSFSGRNQKDISIICSKKETKLPFRMVLEGVAREMPDLRCRDSNVKRPPYDHCLQGKVLLIFKLISYQGE